MSIKVDDLRAFLADYDGDERIEVHGVRDGLKYHFHELYGRDTPTITVCVEGSRDYQSVQNDIEREEQDD
jgi:hypothetical protein